VQNGRLGGGAGFHPQKRRGAVETRGGGAGDMWGGVGEVVTGVQSAEREIGRGSGFSPPKPNMECIVLNNDGGRLKLAVVMQEICRVR
jgi:hypothetical protein